MKNLSFFSLTVFTLFFCLSSASRESNENIPNSETLEVIDTLENNEVIFTALGASECSEAMACPCNAQVYGLIDGLNENEVGWLRIKNYTTGAVITRYIPHGLFSFYISTAKGNLHGIKLCNKIGDINFPGNETYAYLNACGSAAWVVGDCHEHYFIPQYCN